MPTQMNVDVPSGGNLPAMSDPILYDKWKSLCPFLYDFFVNHKLAVSTHRACAAPRAALHPLAPILSPRPLPHTHDLPTDADTPLSIHLFMQKESLACRWGADRKRSKLKNVQTAYYSEQRNRGDVEAGDLNKLHIVEIDIVEPRASTAEKFSNFKNNFTSPFVRRHVMTIFHPGECNRIREIGPNPNLITTHTDSPNVLLWNVKTQPKRGIKGDKIAKKEPSKPDAELEGHTGNAEFALATHANSPYVVSGGSDNLVVLWSIEDHMSTLGLSEAGSCKGRVSWNSGGAGYSQTKINARQIFRGHKQVVGDVDINPNDCHQIVSVGDDGKVLFWDERTGESPVQAIDDAFGTTGGDPCMINCVQYNPNDDNMLLTGSGDGRLKLFDCRYVGDKRRRELKEFKHDIVGDENQIMWMEWSPFNKDVFASSDKQGIVNVWDLSKANSDCAPEGKPNELLIQHAGHRFECVDFHWNPYEDWTILSVSYDQVTNDDGAQLGEGGATLQVWRISEHLTRSQDEIIAELEAHRKQGT